MIPVPEFLRALKAGEEIANAVRWKNRSALVGAVSLLLVSTLEIAKVCGVDLPFAEDQIPVVVGAGVAIAFNLWATFATSKRVGTKPRQKGARLQWPEIGK